MKKKLRLSRQTIAHLTSGDLQRAIGGANTTGDGAGQQSIKVGTDWEPCQAPISAMTRVCA